MQNCFAIVVFAIWVYVMLGKDLQGQLRVTSNCYFECGLAFIVIVYLSFKLDKGIQIEEI